MSRRHAQPAAYGPTPCAGPQTLDEVCYHCDPIGVFGLVPADDPRYLGGYVDARGLRHDPVKHAADCPTLVRP